MNMSEGVIMKLSKKHLRDYIKSRAFKIDLLLCIALLCFGDSAFGIYYVPTGSMKPTISEGDCFFANKLAYNLRIPFTDKSILSFGNPARGDIIAFENPVDERMFTKRVIGIPGDKIKIKAKRLYINDKRIDLSFSEMSKKTITFTENLLGFNHKVQYYHLITKGDDFNEIVIPGGYYFVMGDNRDNSYDSRAWGLVPITKIRGKLLYRFFSFDTKNYYLPRCNRIGKLK